MLSFLIEETGLIAHLVPILYTGKYNKDIINYYTDGWSWLATKNGDRNQIREGIVIKPVKERFDPVLGRVVVKSINSDYSTRKNGTEYQ